jgi:hypothetical protein
MFRRRWPARVLLAAATALSLTVALLGQDVTTGRMTGYIRHADGSALPGATVTAKNDNTGLTVAAFSDKDGFYKLVNLPTGFYTITAALDGFRTAVREHVRLLLGSALSLDFTLELATVKESISVLGEAPVVEGTNTTISSTITTEQVEELPLKNRDFKDLVLLTPETRIESERGTLSISGQRGINTNVTVDGVDYNNAFFGGTVGGAEGRAPLSLSQESIKEFTVITNGASVEFGRSGGGFVNVVTKSGTNAYHGAGFFYWQPQALIANFADGTEPRDQDKMQFGGSIGGPIVKDHLFFFGSFDDQLKDETVPITQQVLDPDIFEEYPELASPPDYVQTQDGWVAFGRLDWQATGGQRIMGRANRVEYDGINGTSNAQTRTDSYNGIEGMSTWAAVGQWTGQFSASALNDLSINYVDEDTPREDKGRNLTEVQYGSFRYGEVGFLPIVSTAKRFGIGDTFSYLLSNHVLKAGGEYNDTSIDQIFKGNWRGVYVFNSNEADILAGRWREYRQFGGLNGLTADEAGRADFGQKEYAFFVQDQWFVNSKLTVTAGVRWEYLNNPNDPILNQNDVNPDGSFALNGEIPDTKNQWSPRLSFSYAPDPKTAFRVAAGRYWSRTPAILWAQLFTSNGIRGTQYIIRAAQSGGNVVGPPTDPLAPGWGDAFDPEGVEPIDFTQVPNPSRPGVFAVDPDFENPHTDRIGVSFEREIFPLVSAALEGTYAKTYHLQRLKDINRVYSGGTAPNLLPLYSSTLPNPYYGRITTSVSDAQSIYDAISLQLTRRYSQSWSAGVAVTFSHDRDNDSNERNFAGIQAEDYNDVGLNYGYSNRDQRWKLAANGIWDTPLWEISLSGSFTFQTGSPYNATANADLNNDGEGTTDRPTVGGVHFRRNAFRQPDFSRLDLQLAKRFQIDPVGIQIAAQCFNCLNAGNRFVTNTVWGNVPTDPTDPNSPRGQIPAPGFGLPVGVYQTPLTGQVAIRVDF